MRWGGLVIALLVLGTALAASTGIEPAMPTLYSDSKIGSVRIDSESCNVSQAFIDSVKNSIAEEMNLTDYAFSNLSSSYCYSYGDYESISLNFVFKKSESDFISKNVGASFYVSNTYDFDILFNEKENNALDYTLKQKYADYVTNGTDGEYYVSIYSSCDNLSKIYDSFTTEKYFNDENGYCTIILKTKTSELKGLVNENTDYIYYFGDKIKYSFSGYSSGTFDLLALSQSIKCDLSKNDYYYPASMEDCYGIYKDSSRVYFNFYNESMSVNVYGLLNGKGRLTISSYGNASISEVTSFANDVLSKYFTNTFSFTLEETEWGSLESTNSISSLELNNDALANLNVTVYQMNTYYSSDNVYLTVSEPYIELYAPDVSTTTVTSNIGSTTVSSTASSVSDVSIRPYYWGQSLIITKDKVYSSVTLSENDMSLAVTKLNEYVGPYVSTSDWALNMTVVNSYYPPIIYYGMKNVAMETATSSGSGVSQDNGIRNASNPGVSLNGVIGVRDALNSQYNVDFTEFTTPTVWEAIVDFFKGIFNIA